MNQNKGCTDARWAVEIWNKEDDIPGTTQNVCFFQEPQWWLNWASPVSAPFQEHAPDSIPFELDREQWRGAVIPTSFTVWDVHPNP